MTTISPTGFAHRAHPRARRRQLFGKRGDGRAGPPMDKANLTIAIDPNSQIKS